MASTASRWIKPEIYPLFAAMGVATALCVFALGRKVIADPGISFSKEIRSHGLADDVKQGERYKLHYVRRYVANHPPEIFPALNGWGSGTKSTPVYSNK